MQLVSLLLLVGCRPDVVDPVGDSAASEDSPEPTGSDTGELVDPCSEPLALLVSPDVEDQGDASGEGGAAALLATVPEGCEAVLWFEEAQPFFVHTDLTVPSWATASFSDGAWLDIEASATVLLEGGLDAGRHRIFSDAGVIGGAPAIDAAWPEWFGAACDDDRDDHDGLQRAADFFATVALDEGVYDVADTVVLSDGARLAGPEGGTATLRSALVHPETGGFHPTRMLEATGVSDIEIRDLVLDGNRHAHIEEPWHYPETDNLARFEYIVGLVFERVHVTGWEANWGIEDQSYAAPTAVLRSSGVRWTDVSFTDSRTEGFLFEECAEVSIERLSTQNTDVWTPLNVFYVTGFSLTDSTIVEDEGIEWTGSTANLSVSDALVSGNTFTGGWGVDFGDEVGTTPWGPTNIRVEDNRIETVATGLYFSPYAEGDHVSGVVLRGNELTLHRGDDPSATDVVIRLDASADVLIEDNVLDVPDAGDAMVQGIGFRGSTDGVLVQGNTMTGVDAGVTHSGDTSESGDLEIRDNAIHCADSIRMNSWSGGSTGVWIFRYLGAEFGTITVADNVIDGHGGWVSLIDYATLSSDQPPFVDALVVTGNTFGPESGSERDVFSEAAATITITGNTPEWVNP